jgi:hypothetical protein
MIIKCKCCKREFDTQKQRKQHEKDAHPEGWLKYTLKQMEAKVSRHADNKGDT